jgi:RNA polymerase-binding protein DksA
LNKASPTKDAASTPTAVPAKRAAAKKHSAPAKNSAPAKTTAKAVAKKKGSPATESGGSTAAKKVSADLSAAEIAEIRTQLVTEMSDMRTEYDELMLQVDQLQQDHTDGAGDDQADAGSKTFEREQQISIASNRFDLLTQMQHALDRIDAGAYGHCEMCGQPIPRARLQAFPMATLDVACKQREERR